MTTDTNPATLPGPAEVAAYLGVPVKTIYAWRCAGKGPRSIKVGRHVRFRWADVEAWLDAHASDA